MEEHGLMALHRKALESSASPYSRHIRKSFLRAPWEAIRTALLSSEGASSLWRINIKHHPTSSEASSASKSRPSPPFPPQSLLRKLSFNSNGHLVRLSSVRRNCLIAEAARRYVSPASCDRCPAPAPSLSSHARSYIHLGSPRVRP